MDNLRAVFERSTNERRAREGLPPVHLALEPKDPTAQETWVASHRVVYRHEDVLLECRMGVRGRL
jgi:hypothetical protein